jgi:[ribosomal protein S5]-alanine N-acetyltransferase
MTETYELTTARLRLGPLAMSDLDALQALWTGAGVRRYLWDGEIVPLERTRDVIAESERLFATRRFGLWAARAASERDLIGFGGFWHFRDPPDLELLYGVAEPAWNRGYATEIAQAVIDYGFGVLGKRTIQGSTDAANTASVRVLEKLGFRFARRALVDRLDTVFYEKARPAAD